jgi:hypothetical protein
MNRLRTDAGGISFSRNLSPLCTFVRVRRFRRPIRVPALLFLPSLTDIRSHSFPTPCRMDPTPLPAANGAPGISHFGPAATEIEREKLVAPALVGGLKGSIVVVQKPSLDDAFEAPETVDSAAAGIVQVVQPEADAAPDVSIEEVPLTVHQPPSDTEAADEPHGHGTVTRSSLFDPEATGGPQRRHTHAGASEQYLVPIRHFAGRT